MNEVRRARSGIVARGCARGRVCPLACLIAIAVCAFTAAGNDRFTAAGQWIRRAGQADLARLRAPWDPLAGRYRAPDEKTIRVLLGRLDPPGPGRAAAGAPAGCPRPACAATVPGATPGTRVHLPGAAGHGGRPLDHLEVGAKHNETSHFTELLEPVEPVEPVDLAGAEVMTVSASGSGASSDLTC